MHKIAYIMKVSFKSDFFFNCWNSICIVKMHIIIFFCIVQIRRINRTRFSDCLHNHMNHQIGINGWAWAFYLSIALYMYWNAVIAFDAIATKFYRANVFKSVLGVWMSHMCNSIFESHIEPIKLIGKKIRKRN